MLANANASTTILSPFQRDHAQAVLIGAAEYEELVEELELLRDVRTAESQIDAGEGVAQSEVESRLTERLKERLGG